MILEYTLDWSITWRRAMAPVLQEMRLRYPRKRMYGPGIYSIHARPGLWFRNTRYSVFGGRGIPLIEMELDENCRRSIVYGTESARLWWQGAER